MKFTNRTALLMVLAMGAAPDAVSACSVPVFRYAIEQWQPDSYLVTVYHRGPLSEAETELLQALQPIGADGRVIANIDLLRFDLDDPQNADAADQLPEEAALPWMTVDLPPRPGVAPRRAVSCAFNGDNVEKLVDSPVRQAIAKQLLEGSSVVWVLLDGANAIENESAEQLLKTELARLEGILELPPVDPADFAELSISPDALKVAFTHVRVSRDVPAEAQLVEQLLSVEHDLRDPEFVNRAMIFPVFGRGRALYALIGDGIQPGTIEDAGRFLVGACQCTVKAENPGVDLIFPVDWDQFIEPSLPIETALPPLAGLAGFSETETETETVLADASDAAAEPTAPPEPAAETAPPSPEPESESVSVPRTADPASAPSKNVLVLLGVIVAVVVLGSVFLTRSR